MQAVLDAYINFFTDRNDFVSVAIRFTTLFTVLTIGMFSLRLVGKKSISQLTLPNVVFVFIFTTCMGALITQPRALFIALEITIAIIVFIIVIELIQLKYDWIEQLLVGRANILVREGVPDQKELKKAKVSIDQLESLVRLQGLPSIEVCKTITLEPNGNIGVEVKPEYEPIKKIYFDAAIEQILKAINEKQQYSEAVPPEMGNVFEEAKGKLDKKDKNT